MKIERFNVLSLFDGGSMAYPAIIKAGVSHLAIKYYAVEIDKFARQVGDKRVYPIIRPTDDVRLVNGFEFPRLDLLIGGSPCQNLSIAGDGTGLKGDRSSLFWEFVRIKEESNPKYWLLENVASMKQVDCDIISDALGVEPIMINSALVSGQMRKRYYWTNIPNIEQPEDQHISLSSVLENGSVDRLKAYCIDANYFKGNNLKGYIEKKRRQVVFNKPMRVGTIGNGGQGERIYHIDGKSVALSANGGGRGAKTGLYEFKDHIRKLTPLECERLQTLPDGWTDVGLSNTQRYKVIGNGFTVDVIAHILSHIPELNA